MFCMNKTPKSVTEMEMKEEGSRSSSSETAPLLPPNPEQSKIPTVEINLYRQGKGPIDVIKSNLVGYEVDQLDVGTILENYKFKCIYAFKPGTGRGVPIRFNARSGRSILPYKDGAVIHVDGEPKDSVIKPITRILVGVSAITICIVLVMRESPQWAKKLNFSGNNISPWIIACAVIVFTRMRKRTKAFLEKRW